MGWDEIECTVCDLKGLKAELAEIDENYVRNNLSTLEYGELLLRRKEIYEVLHPETKATYEGGFFKGNQYQKSAAADSAATNLTKSFTRDASEKLGLAPRTVRAQMQAARDLTSEAKSVILGSNVKVTKENTLKLSRLLPEEQVEAARLLTTGRIHSVDEYEPSNKADESSKVVAAESAATTFDENKRITGYNPEFRGRKVRGDISMVTVSPEEDDTTTEKLADRKNVTSHEPEESLPRKQPLTMSEIIADLKNHDKDASATPEAFLASITCFAVRMEEEIAWYAEEYYQPVFPRLSSEQMEQLHEVVRRIGAAAEHIYSQVKKYRKKGSST